MASQSPCAEPPVLQYRPSRWEWEWRGHHAFEVEHDDSRNWTRGCSLMLNKTAEIDAWLAFARLRRPTFPQREPPAPSAKARDALSFLAKLDGCTGQTLALMPLEPLVGFLRHPQAHCHQFPSATPWVRNIQRKDYLLPAWRSEVLHHGKTSALFFDLGASLYAKGNGGASMSWFVDEYEARGIHFDRIFAWEATKHADATIYEAMPTRIVDRIAYYNVPVDPTVGAKHNPWRTLRAVSTPHDFVVVKLDIDNSRIEEALVEQLLEDRSLAKLVDELYFEHHVLHTPMWRGGWRATTVTNHTLVDSYQMFVRLRELGIRAHSWV